jgi:hypothetical protein
MPTDEMISLAKENGVVILRTDKTLYNTCGLLYSNGLSGFTGANK